MKVGDLVEMDWIHFSLSPQEREHPPVYGIITKVISDKNVKYDDKLNDLYQSLKEINSKLWVIEDDKRQCEKDKDFGEKFIKLSRDVHFLNDDRAKIKLEINNHTGSAIKEIKEYTSY